MSTADVVKRAFVGEPTHEAKKGADLAREHPFYFEDSQVVLKASQSAWFHPSLLINHLPKGKKPDI